MAKSQPVNEAISRLSSANHAFNALMTMLANGGNPIDPEDMYCLLQPIVGEVESSLDELNTIT